MTSFFRGGAVAEQSTHYEFTAVSAKDILPAHQAEWNRFTGFVTYSVVAVVVLLLLLLLFVV